MGQQAFAFAFMNIVNAADAQCMPKLQHGPSECCGDQYV